jgi:hypothetical protein
MERECGQSREKRAAKIDTSKTAKTLWSTQVRNTRLPDEHASFENLDNSSSLVLEVTSRFSSDWNSKHPMMIPVELLSKRLRGRKRDPESRRKTFHSGQPVPAN